MQITNVIKMIDKTYLGFTESQLSMDDDERDAILVMLSVPSDDGVFTTKWVELTSTELAECKISSGSNLIAMAGTLMQQVQQLIVLARDVVCDDDAIEFYKVPMKSPLLVVESNKKARIIRDNCTGCRLCVLACPTDAIKMIDR